MAIYQFECAVEHVFEKRVPMGTREADCACGRRGFRAYIPGPVAHSSGRPTTMEPPADFHRLNSEAIAAKHEAMAERDAAIQNGWDPAGGSSTSGPSGRA